VTTYDDARRRLLDAELELMLQREQVAQLRRGLPPGPVVDDYTFAGPDGSVALSELFTAPDRPLLLYHFMYGGASTDPCPMCSMWTDGWAAVGHHVAARMDLALVTAAPIDDTLAMAARNGWESLRWLSAAGTTFKSDIGGEDPEGNQWPFLSVYTLGDDGPRLTYSGGAHLVDEHWRGLDLLSPVWHFFDLTPEGRGDWMPPPRL
jgi:predicted dithiol-disulfide oxidoreductase (DUF899 family)